MAQTRFNENNFAPSLFLYFINTFNANNINSTLTKYIIAFSGNFGTNIKTKPNNNKITSITNVEIKLVL